MSERDEFYVGYQPKMPPGTRRFVATRLAGLLALAGVLLVAWLQLHRPGDLARSDFRDARDFEGVLLAEPAPHLVVLRPGETGERAFSRYFLIGRGKSGPKIDVSALAGHTVRVNGTLLYRDSQTWLSVKKAEAIDPPTGGELDPSGAVPMGEFTLRGEIVDSKCFMGTMRPGHTKTHRGCAIRCIAGGIPPVLLVRDGHGNALYFLLVDAEGGAVNDRVLDLVADPIEITGEVQRIDDVFVLRADPDGYRRL